MPAFSYKKATEGGYLKEKDTQRLAALCLVLQDQMKPTGKDFEAAAKETGGTKGSFEFAYRQILKKMKENGAYVDGEGEASGPAAGEKRKGGDKDVEATPTPAPKKKARAAGKKVVKKEVEDEDEDEDEV